MKPTRQSTPEDDAALFSQAMSDVKRINVTHRRPDAGPQPSARPQQSEADEAQVMRELLDDASQEGLESGDSLLYRANGLPDSVLRKLRRGQYRIEGECDLHGFNRDAARVEVTHFLAHARDRGWHCVRIIHGKGKGSLNSGPVLKIFVDGWLRRRHEVLAFCSARPVDGGSGAIYVLLRAPGA